MAAMSMYFQENKDIISNVLIVGSLFFITKEVLNWINWSRKLPPGPTGIPLLGYAPFLTKKPHLKFLELSKTYGSVFSLKLGSKYVVILNDWKSIKAALSNDAFLGRPEPALLSAISPQRSLLDLSGPLWKEQRRFALHHFRDLGFGKSTMEEKIREEIRYLLDECQKDSLKGPVNFFNLLTPSVSNNICILIFGQRFDYDNEHRIMMDKALSTVPEFIATTGILLNFPSLARFLMRFNLFGFDRLKEAFKTVHQFVRREVDEHRATLDEGNPRDYIDSFLIEQNKRKRNATSVDNFPVEMLVQNTRGFFGAGSETVRTSTCWAMMVMAKYQEIQEKVQLEIDEIIGQEKKPSWNDRLNMPYTQAVIMELQRWASVVPLNIPRRTLEDTHVNGVSIPKDMMVLANFWAVHHDPQLWEKPDAFYPEHFLDAAGNLVKREELVAFSYGKRNCVGETLAQVELFLYITSILQAFKVLPPKGGNISFESKLGLTLQTKQEPILELAMRNQN